MDKLHGGALLKNLQYCKEDILDVANVEINLKDIKVSNLGRWS